MGLPFNANLASRCRAEAIGSDLQVNLRSKCWSPRFVMRGEMKLMLMMNAPRGRSGDWQVANWSADDLKAHIGFMRRLNTELSESGELVGAEGLASPGDARIVRAAKSGAPEVTDGPFAEAKEFLA